MSANARAGEHVPGKFYLATEGVSTLPSGKRFAHRVAVEPSRHGGLVLVLEPVPPARTPVAIRLWRVDLAFLDRRGPLAIDLGQGWALVNADEVRDEIRHELLASGALLCNACVTYGDALDACRCDGARLARDRRERVWPEVDETLADRMLRDGGGATIYAADEGGTTYRLADGRLLAHDVVNRRWWVLS